MKLSLKLDEDHPLLTVARTLFPLFALGMAILNIVGKPPQIVHDHWDKKASAKDSSPGSMLNPTTTSVSSLA